jgi:proteasome lid subunit RPN8/RPN11
MESERIGEGYAHGCSPLSVKARIVLQISREDLDCLIGLARAGWPLEVCGLLAGRGSRVEKIYPIANRLNSRSEFELAPRPFVAAVFDLEARGFELQAIYHSHPDGPAAPSPTDIIRAAYPETFQVIVSLADPARPSVAAYRLADGQVEAIALEVV